MSYKLFSNHSADKNADKMLRKMTNNAGCVVLVNSSRGSWWVSGRKSKFEPWNQDKKIQNKLKISSSAEITMMMQISLKEEWKELGSDWKFFYVKFFNRSWEEYQNIWFFFAHPSSLFYGKERPCADHEFYE